MAKSKAQKIRDHKIRNGRLDPSIKRGITPEISTHERKLPTLTEKLRKKENKYKHKIEE